MSRDYSVQGGPFRLGGRSTSDPEMVGNYALIEPIGSGNFGVVYLAQHVHLADRKAVKLFQAAKSDEQVFRAFERSARYVSALDHPNIVKVHDFGVVQDTAFLVMDLIEPGTSIDLLYEQIPTNVAVELLCQLATALEYAHQAEFIDLEGNRHRGIFHGDIKPSNILVGGERAFLTDFMLPNMEYFKQRSFGHPTFPSYDTSFYGTPMYMAPEQLKGVVNHQTDVFSFGVTAYELLSRNYPWDSKEEFGHYGEHKPATSISKVTDSIPTGLVALVDSCISPHAGDRPSSFAEIRQQLDEIQQIVVPIRPEVQDHAEERYDIALSFAGSERPIAQKIYEKLRESCSVFYDQAPGIKAKLWGADLSDFLHAVYSERSTYCIALISEEYVNRAWTNWERRAILQRMITSRGSQYILPVRIDNTDIRGITGIVGVLNLSDEGIDGVVATALSKLRHAKRP